MDASIDAIRVAGTPEGPAPVILLTVDGEDGLLPIFVGPDQAIDIARGMDAVNVGRPLSHDLLLDVIEELGGRVDRVVVSEVRDDTYIADLHLDTPRDSVVVDARPSDALALAARTGAPIAVAASVFEDGCRERSTFDELERIQEVAEL